jgi:CubicO group peptidase (beta-lactamase class C family)
MQKNLPRFIRLPHSLLFLIAFFFLLPVRAQVNVEDLDTYFQSALEEWEIPGMAIAIVKDGEVVLSKGYGVLEAGKKAKVNEHTNFAIASNTKAFISASIAMLVEEGKLDWNDPVRKYIPDFELYDPYVSMKMTVRDLLCHRSGLGTFSGDVMWYKTDASPADLIKRLKYLPQASGFRTEFGYSNLMFITAGEVIRAVSGDRWDAFAKARIFDPLNMDRTLTSTNDLKGMKNVASPHKPVNGENQPIEWVNWDNMGAAGGIISNADDMAQWLRLQLHHGDLGEDRLFSSESQDIMWHPWITLPLSPGARSFLPGRNFSAYGLGWSLYDYHGKLVVSHGGGYDGMYSKVAMVPDENMGIVVLTNSMRGIGSYLIYEVIDRYLGVDSPKDWSKTGAGYQRNYEEGRRNTVSEREAGRRENTQPSFQLEDYTGTFTSDMYGDIEIKLEDKALRMAFVDAPQLNATLSHWHFDVFKIEWDQIHAWFDFGTVQFVMDNNANITGLRFDVPNDDIFFDELVIKKK